MGAQVSKDQRENHRREQEIKRISTLSSAEQQAARDAEDARQKQYDSKINGEL
jgi:hypothetical protein